MMTSGFKRLICSRSDLNLRPVLTGGQSFRWKETTENEYLGVFNSTIWELKQMEDCLMYRAHNSLNNNEIILRSYLRLDFDLQRYYKKWSKSDKLFNKVSAEFPGIRMLNQDIVENIFSFICSSNNNISRISGMVKKLCELYGSYIGTVNGEKFWDFPSVNSLTEETVEPALRKAGFGYRAKFIHQTACQIQLQGGQEWIDQLKKMPYDEAKGSLMKLPGVGPKVADCICLMSLGHLQTIPVDTHIFQIASQRYLPHLQGCKSVTPRVYKEITDHFQHLYGEYAGWAHTVLFCADLKSINKQKKKAVKRKSS